MAKLSGPLFSLAASQQIGKALVYFTWKGINVVRQHVVPANPKSDAQNTQRGYMTSAVAEWHGATYTASDITAWNRLANIAASAMSGFNRLCHEFMTEKKLGNVWTRIRAGEANTVTATTFVAACRKAAGAPAPTVRWGVSPTNLPNSMALETGGGDVWQNLVTPLTANTLYYFSFDVGVSETTWGRLGIYQQKTLAA